jgi:hypothetical protein
MSLIVSAVSSIMLICTRRGAVVIGLTLPVFMPACDFRMRALSALGRTEIPQLVDELLKMGHSEAVRPSVRRLPVLPTLHFEFHAFSLGPVLCLRFPKQQWRCAPSSMEIYERTLPRFEAAVWKRFFTLFTFSYLYLETTIQASSYSVG